MLRLKRSILGLLVGTWAFLPSDASAGEPIFGYSYLTDTLPAGEREFEQWATLHTGKQQRAGFYF